MSHRSDDAINYVNADFIAEEKGIKIETEELNESCVYKNLIKIKITTSDGNASSIDATIFDDKKERIVSINGFDIEVALKSSMILFKNTDVPGVIGKVGTILGNNKVNISDFSPARNDKEEALAVILVDNDVDDKTLEELESLDACLNVNYVRI
jgi:D-3-phosphoglycerate dehydrogenase